MHEDETLPADEPIELGRASADPVVTDQSGTTTWQGRPPRIAIDDELPKQIGRYRVRRRIGAGGMGVVLEAHDEQLDRLVAIKLLRSLGPPAGHTRMLREAQALAQLSHPNVVQIFEVGMQGSRAFLVMELVDGMSLSRWLGAEPHRPDELIEVFVQAGEGLAAAHAAGFVHRDFKPGNVLVGRDGRVRVLDFGLARASSGVSSEEERSAEDPQLEDPRLEDQLEDPQLKDPQEDPRPGVWQDLTVAGSLMGTPAYMSPEHFGMCATTEASDQFSFCVALYEALYEQHPFGNPNNWQERMHDVLTGVVHEPPDQPEVPQRVRRAVMRGLANEPSQRWPSMRALLDQLRRPPSSRRWIGQTLVGGVTLGAVLWAMAPMPGDVRSPACTGAEPKLAEVWGPDARVAGRQAFRNTELPYAAPTWQRVEQRLDAYATQWTSAYARACEAPPRDPRAHDRRMACIERLRGGLKAQVEALTTADAAVVEQAVAAVAGLRDPSGCLEPDEDGFGLDADDPEQAASLEALMRQLDQVEALLRSGKSEPGHALAQQALERARAMGSPRAEAAALLQLGMAQQELGALDSAVSTLEQAYFLASKHDDGPVARSAASLLVDVIGVQQEDYERGLEWSRHARVEIERGGSDADRQTYLVRLGLLFMRRGTYTRALETFEQALALSQAGSELGELGTSKLLGNMGIALRRQGQVPRAIELQEQALEIRERVLSSEHPLLANTLRNLAAAYADAQRLQDAERAIRRALTINEAIRGPGHITNFISLNNLGMILYRQSRYDEAEQTLAYALQLVEGNDDRLHTRGRVFANLALVQYRQGALQEAERNCRRSMDILTNAGLDEHPDFAQTLVRLGMILEVQQEYERAEAHARRALAILDDSAERHPSIRVDAHVVLATLSIARHRFEAARDHAERVRALGVSTHIAVSYRVIIDFVLAQARWHLEPSRREESLAEIREAAEIADRLGPGYAPLRDQIQAKLQAWRAAHEPGTSPEDQATGQRLGPPER